MDLGQNLLKLELTSRQGLCVLSLHFLILAKLNAKNKLVCC